MFDERYYILFDREQYLPWSPVAARRVRFFREKILPIIRDYLEPPILDVGCGGGVFTFALSRDGFDVVGVDRSRFFRAVFGLAARFFGLSNTIFLNRDVTKEPLALRPRTAVFLGNVLWDIPSSRLADVILNINRPENLVFDFIDNESIISSGNWKRRIAADFDGKRVTIVTESIDKEKMLRRFVWGGREYQFAHYIWSPERLRGILERVGYRMLLCRAIAPNHYVCVFSRLPQI